ncbi:MAG: sensor histidine kinase [Phycisphaerae bacterium]
MLNAIAKSCPDTDLSSVLSEYLSVTSRLQETHERLQQEVVRLRSELASKDRELERKRRLAALGELAAGMAHEVRNPLGAIRIYSGLLRDECLGNEPVRELLDKIEVGIRAIDGVVQDTLSLSPRSKGLTVQPIQPILVSAVEMSCGHLQRRDVSVVLECNTDSSCIAVEADGLRRVLINLLVNAADASTPGSEIVLAATVTGAMMHVTVQDTGSGIPPELLDQIFNPFVTTKDHGTGLGLTIAHRLIETYGGELSAANREEGGAEFRISLPLATEPTVGESTNFYRDQVA